MYIKFNKVKKNFNIAVRELLVFSQSHGIPKIVSNKRLTFKFLWAICVLISFGYLLKVLINIVACFLSYSSMATFQNIDQNPMLFPTITFCLLNPPLKEYNLSDAIISCTFGQKLNCLDEKYIIIYKNFRMKYCYQFNYNNSSLLQTKRGGRHFGLKIKFFIGTFNEKRDHYLGPIERNGLHVSIHNKSIITSNSEGLEVSPGATTNIMINKITDTKLSVPYNDCIRDLKTYPKFDSIIYSKIKERNLIYRQKDCLEFAFLYDNNCSFTEDDYYLNCSKSGFNISSLTDFYEKDIYKNYTHKCPYECKSYLFDIKSSLAAYPSYDEYLSLGNNSNLYSKYPNDTFSYEEIKKSVVSVNIYYEEMKYLRIKQTPKTELWDLISNIGGSLSLFLGVSFLSFVELVQIPLEFIFLLYENRN